jgi:hypothetical protein
MQDKMLSLHLGYLRGRGQPLWDESQLNEYMKECYVFPRDEMPIRVIPLPADVSWKSNILYLVPLAEEEEDYLLVCVPGKNVSSNQLSVSFSGASRHQVDTEVLREILYALNRQRERKGKGLGGLPTRRPVTESPATTNDHP